MKHYTFSPEGLRPAAIKFLEGIEEDFLKGISIQRTTHLYNKASEYRLSDRKDIIEAYEYWEFIPKPIMFFTAKEPVLLSELLLESPSGKYLINNKNYKSGKFIKTDKFSLIEINMLEGLTTYYELINNHSLYIKYDQILGSRYIANVINDIKSLQNG